MRLPILACAVIAAMACHAPALAQSAADEKIATEGTVGEGLSGEALRREVSGMTIAGVHFRTFMRFSEYHSPDGRIFGHNGGVPVDRGCWDVQNDEVCYYYSGDSLPRGTWCWTFHRLATRNQYRLEHRVTGGLALGVREEGNPRNWTDNGQPWHCDGLVSQNRRPQQSIMQARQNESQDSWRSVLHRISRQASGPSIALGQRTPTPVAP